MNLRSSLTRFGVCIALLSSASISFAQQGATADAPRNAADNDTVGLQEITVTATKQGETTLERTPLAVSAFTGEQLDKSFVVNVKDLVQYTPNLNFAQVTASAAIYIRGIGTNAVFNGSDPDVAVNVDGVYMARAFSQLADFVDVDRIEILRGPQGTLYGRNAVGGVINVISRLPGDDFASEAQVTVGSFATVQGQGFVSGPIIPGVLSASISANYLRHDGYTYNLYPGSDNLGDANRGAVRGQLRWRPTDGVEAVTRFDFSALGENIQAYDVKLAALPFNAPLGNSVVGQYHTVAQNNPQTNHERLSGISEDIRWHLSDAIELKSLSAYRHSNYTVVTDTDASELTVNNSLMHDDSNQFSQEFNLSGHVDRLDYVAGLYYFREREESINEGITVPSIFTPPARALLVQALPFTVATSKAAFFQVTGHITHDLSAVFGARYTEDTKALDLTSNRFTYGNAPLLGPQAPGFPFIADLDPKFHASTPKAGLNWQLNDDDLLYFSYSKGFKSGGNNFAATSLVGITYKPETVSSYEAGIKTQWWDRRLRLNLTGFYYNYDDLQVQSLIGPGNAQIANAASAIIKGLEFESMAQLTSKWLLTANVSFLDAKYDSFAGATVPGGIRPYLVGDPRYNAVAGTYNASGNELNAAPRYTSSLAAQYTQPISIGSLFGRAEYYWQDRIFYDPSNALVVSQGSYGLVNLAAGFNPTGSVWSTELAVKNLANKNYFTTLAANGYVPSGYSGPPRTILLRVTGKF
jgi:iron complex outermembrane receptor protein